MPRGIALLTYTLFWCTCSWALSAKKLRGEQLLNEPSANHSDPKEHNVTISHFRNTVPAEERVGAAHLDSHYCGCNSSACNVDVGKVEEELQNDLVLIIGCSLDINAIDYFCEAVGAQVQNFQTKNPFSYLAHCDVGKFTVAYMFHPGASPPPYFGEYGGTATTFNLVRNSVHDVQLQFGRQPTAIVVDASLWDVSNWWQKHGRPADPYPVPRDEINLWCHSDVPNLLRWVQKHYPSSGVAFRTPPQVFMPNGYGQNPANIEEMVKCIEEQKDPVGRLYSTFGFVDFHNFVDTVLQNSAGPPMQTWYKDHLHPGPQLSMMYINRVLNWVRSLKA